MPYRPEAELKRPDLKGEFLCGHCGKTFCHAASLNRHRLNFHGDDQQCLICNRQLETSDTVRRHMLLDHAIHRVFTCGCCNWTFPDKKELHSHNNSMTKTGTPGEAKAIAISSRPPGSLSQHELRGEERTPRAKKRASRSTAGVPASGDDLMSMISQFLTLPNSSEPSTSAPVVPQLPAIPAAWLQNLILANPFIASYLNQASSSASSTTSSSETENGAGSPEPSKLEMALSSIANNNEGEESANEDEGEEKKEVEVVAKEEDDKDFLVKSVGADFLSVSTEHQGCSNSSSSLSESGIGSVPHSNTPSPIFSTSQSPADLLEDFLQKHKKANKRRSIDDICNNLSKRTC